jgi:ubiquinone/menaquinone biosynthesis C-methylase UbiE
MILRQTYARQKIHSQWESVYRGDRILKRFNDKCIDKILNHVCPTRDALFLDAGCGTSDHTLRIADRGYRCWGVDLSETVLEIAREDAAKRGLAPRPSFEGQSFEDLRFADDTFDAIYCRGTLMHIPLWVKALANLCRVLKPGGRIDIMESNHKSLEMATVFLVRSG